MKDAREDLEVIAREASGRGFECPGATPWRSAMAIALHQQGEVQRARAVAADDVDRCRAFGAPRALGLALIGLGAVERREPALSALREAVDVLADSPAGSLRAGADRAGLAAAASRPADRGTRDPAPSAARRTECSADALAGRAQAELKVLGARPRRGWQSGLEALTAAEQRVAMLAAGGATNGEIAQELVVTRRTVETHLTSIYRKLEIRGRVQLAEVLTRDPAS